MLKKITWRFFRSEMTEIEQRTTKCEQVHSQVRRKTFYVVVLIVVLLELVLHFLLLQI